MFDFRRESSVCVFVCLVGDVSHVYVNFHRKPPPLLTTSLLQIRFTSATDSDRRGPHTRSCGWPIEKALLYPRTKGTYIYHHSQLTARRSKCFPTTASNYLGRKSPRLPGTRGLLAISPLRADRRIKKKSFHPPDNFPPSSSR